MNFNYWVQRRLFELDQAKKRKEYTAAGMNDEAIKEMYKYDLYVFNNERKEMKHRAYYSEMLSYDPETGEFHYKDMDEFPATKFLHIPGLYDWVDQLTNRNMYFDVINLDWLCLTVVSLRIKGYANVDIAKMTECSNAKITRCFYRLEKIFEKYSKK